MSEIRTAEGSKHQFAVERISDDRFRIFGLSASSPTLVIRREQAQAWLEWMENDGINKLHQLLKEGEQ